MSLAFLSFGGKNLNFLNGGITAYTSQTIKQYMMKHHPYQSHLMLQIHIPKV
jgi:hypothetical protein